MKYGEISENDSINEFIYDCFQYLCPEDILRFVREFRSQPHAESQVLHTFRELVLGSYLARNDIRVRAYQKIDGKEPDWSVLGERRELLAVIDVVNFHADKQSESHIHDYLSKGKTATLAMDDKADSLRVYQSIKNKCTAYRELLSSRAIPYVIALFLQFEVTIPRSEIVENLYSLESGLFQTADERGYPDVSGLVVYSDSCQLYQKEALLFYYEFEYFPNPHAFHPFSFPSGFLYPPLLVKNKFKYMEAVKILSQQA